MGMMLLGFIGFATYAYGSMVYPSDVLRDAGISTFGLALVGLYDLGRGHRGE
jgi:hypothetical protein